MKRISDEHHVSSSDVPQASWWARWVGSGEPHLARGPFARWPHASEAALAVCVFLTSMVAVAVSALDDGEPLTFDAIVDRPWGGFALLGLAAASLFWRRRHPIPVTAFVLLVMVTWAVAGYGDGQELALVVATYSVGRYTSDHRQSLTALVAVVAISILGTVIDTQQRVDVAPALLLSALPWYVGRRIRSRGDYLQLLKDRAEQLEAEQHARARQAVAEERTRIARELHDVVAHRVSMMTVQAGAAKTVARDDLESAIDAMGDVELAGRKALGELRHLLGVLRPDTADPGQLGPQAGLNDIPVLADDLSHTGAEVRLSMADVPDPLAEAVSLSAYRIVQESLTNVLRHGGERPIVDIDVAVEGDRLVLDIVNSTDRAITDLPSSGLGLIGMRERADVLGGTIEAGPEPPNRYRVRASLPLDMETT